MQVALAIGPKFSSYMENICQNILILLDIDVKLVQTNATASELSKKKGITKVELDLKLLGGKKTLSINIVAL